MSEINNTNGQDNANVQAAVNAAMQEEKKKKKKKKWIILAIVAVVIIIIIAAGSGSDDSGDTSGSNTTNASVEAEKDVAEEGVIGDYKCVVKSAKITTDYEGKKAVIISYDFTNNSDEPASFDFALDDNVYQEGIGLEDAYLGMDEEQDIFDDVEIKPGITKEVKKAYLLRDTETDLEVEITELISFDDAKNHYNSKT